MKQTIYAHISAECPWRDTLYWYDTIDSTNTRAKDLAKAGAPHGTVIIAGGQSGGRGRMGRNFSSPVGMGVYLSVILRPDCSADQLMHLTCAAGVAAVDAIASVTTLCPGIKWANDLILGNKKVGGILTELGFIGSRMDYAIIGIGINCRQRTEDFPEELQSIATSLLEQSEEDADPAKLAAALVENLYKMDQHLITGKAQLMARYRQHCITLGKEILVLQAGEARNAMALDLDADGGLIVEYPDGTKNTVNFGEISIRGICRYM